MIDGFPVQPHGGPRQIPGVLLRTRRSVMEAAHQMEARRQRRRRNIGIALLAVGSLVVLFTPALWTAINDMDGGELFFDMPVMLLTLSLVFVSALIAVMLVSWRDRRRSSQEN
jgi:cytochrome bd-type quinol oxidase subunit 2